jgi:TPR repeat protein
MNGNADKKSPRAEEGAERWFRKGIEFLEMEKLDEAYSCFRHGIELNPDHPMLQFSLGQAFDAGLGVERDDSKAVEWYRKAAEQGMMGAMYFLAQKLEFGQGVRSDREQAIRWHLKAGEGGLPESQYALGEHYLCQREHVSENWPEAARWFRMAAEQGHSNAQLRLAGMFEDGLGVPQDLNIARFWYRKAAAQGSVQAQASLEGLKS